MRVAQIAALTLINWKLKLPFCSAADFDSVVQGICSANICPALTVNLIKRKYSRHFDPLGGFRFFWRGDFLLPQKILAALSVGEVKLYYTRVAQTLL